MGRSTSKPGDLHAPVAISSIATVINFLTVVIITTVTYCYKDIVMSIHLRGPKYAKKFADRQANTRKILAHALQFADHIIALSGRVTFEWPAGAGLREVPEVKELIERHVLPKLQSQRVHMSHSLNSLKGDYMGNYIGNTIGVIKGDTRSLDYSSYVQLLGN